MKARSLVVGGLLAGAMLMATSVGASANVTFCSDDPPILVVTPGGQHLMINNQVYLAAGAQRLKNGVTDQASAQPDGKGGTLITDVVFVPGQARVVASVNRYQVTATKSGADVITLFLDVAVT